METALTPSEFYALLGVHKQQAAESMAFITAFTAIALAILAYLGSARSITTGARVAIMIGFVVFALIDIKALIASRELHQAIHVEIQKSLEERPDLVCSQEFRDSLMKMKLPAEWIYISFHGLFDLLMVGAIWKIGKSKSKESLEVGRV